MAYASCMQPWIQMRGGANVTVTQSEADWLDVSAFQGPRHLPHRQRSGRHAHAVDPERPEGGELLQDHRRLGRSEPNRVRVHDLLRGGAGPPGVRRRLGRRSHEPLAPLDGHGDHRLDAELPELAHLPPGPRRSCEAPRASASEGGALRRARQHPPGRGCVSEKPSGAGPSCAERAREASDACCPRHGRRGHRTARSMGASLRAVGGDDRGLARGQQCWQACEPLWRHRRSPSSDVRTISATACSGCSR
jgi:hypothetical protein